MKKLNERCPLQVECERTCKHVYHEGDCDYYQSNSRPGYEIADQEAKVVEPYIVSTETAETADTAEQAGKLVLVDVDKIHPHPKNPRKDLGDLTELAESIRVNGVLQNLTIVPKPDGPEGHFYAVIGHRRHAGARKAGLKQVPCVISNMDEKEQVRTMMVENMQRSDLTIYEEAEGFQMMLDLGDTITDIAEKTGFSDSTVRHRVKLLELDREKFQKSAARDATLQDYMALEKIKDPDLKNKVLDSIGTANFNYELKRAKEQEREAKRKAEILKELETFATQVEPSEVSGLKYIQWISLSGNTEIKKPDDAEQRKYFYTATSYISLYAEPTEQDKAEDTAQQEQQRVRKEREQQLDKISERAFQLRFEFIKTMMGFRKKCAIIHEMAIRSMMQTGYTTSFDIEQFIELMGLDSDGEDFEFSQLSPALAASHERVLLFSTYANFNDNTRNNYHSWNGVYKENPNLDILYDYLERLGYELSDEEKAYRDGSHEIFSEIEELP